MKRCLSALSVWLVLCMPSPFLERILHTPSRLAAVWLCSCLRSRDICLDVCCLRVSAVLKWNPQEMKLIVVYFPQAADDVRIYIYRNRNFLSPLVVSVSRIPLLHLTVVKTPELKRLLQHVQRVVTRQ